ncbi:MAG TPA: hypothetical protein VGL13_17775, partial [Polyangiaceae bacterium]
FLHKHFADFADSLKPYVEPGTMFASAYDACRGEAEVLVDPRRVLANDAGDWRALDLADQLVPQVRLVRASAPPTLSHRSSLP